MLAKRPPRGFGLKAMAIIKTAKANPEWTLAEVATAMESTVNSVKVILCRARKAGLIQSRPGDRSGYPRHLPPESLPRWHELRKTLSHEYARAAIESEIARGGQG